MTVSLPLIESTTYSTFEAGQFCDDDLEEDDDNKAGASSIQVKQDTGAKAKSSVLVTSKWFDLIKYVV